MQINFLAHCNDICLNSLKKINKVDKLSIVLFWNGNGIYIKSYINSI